MKLNVEEERKAYEAAMRTRAEKGGRTYEEHAFKVSRSECEYLNVMHRFGFDAWLLAKAHAEEMSKPVKVKVYDIVEDNRDVYAICKENGEHIYGSFEYKSDARIWAVDHGYRLLD